MAPRILACLGGRGGSSSTQKNAGKAVVATGDLNVEEDRRMGQVLVELFTSQGCGTSPEAEAVAVRLARGELDAVDRAQPPVVVLCFHVDYWDYMGWKDPFGSSQWTVRQKAYVEALRGDTLYTPQAVVHGRSHCVGTDQDELLAVVKTAPRFAAPTMQMTLQKLSPDSLQANFSGVLRYKMDGEGADLYAALCESGLVTDCAAGENKGRILPNDNVVRCLQKLMSVKDISAKKNLSGSVQFALWEGFSPAKCSVVLFLQNRDLHVLGVQQFKLPETV